MQVFADCFGIAISIVLQTAIDRRHHFLKALNSAAYVPFETFTSPLILTKVSVCQCILLNSL